MKYSEIENNSTLTPDELKGVNIPDPDGKAGDFSNYTFWQYTNVEAICKILGGSCFWVNNISGMNARGGPARCRERGYLCSMLL